MGCLTTKFQLLNSSMIFVIYGNAVFLPVPRIFTFIISNPSMRIFSNSFSLNTRYSPPDGVKPNVVNSGADIVSGQSLVRVNKNLRFPLCSNR